MSELMRKCGDCGAERAVESQFQDHGNCGVCGSRNCAEVTKIGPDDFSVDVWDQLPTREERAQRMKEKWENLELGDFVCDMHDGLSEIWRKGLEYREGSWVQIDHCQDSCAVLTALLKSVGVEENKCEPTNKDAVFTGYSSGGWMQAAYSYDGMKFGVFEFRVKASA